MSEERLNRVFQLIGGTFVLYAVVVGLATFCQVGILRPAMDIAYMVGIGGER